MNLKKLFASFSVVALLATTVANVVPAMATPVPTQYTDAYQFASDNGLTSMSTFEKFNFYGSVSRQAFAKFSTMTLEKMGKNEVKHSEAQCDFSDLNAGDSTLKASVVKACQYGLMGINSNTNEPSNSFKPKDTMTRGQVMTVISRMLDGDKYNGGNPFREKHEENLYNKGVVTKRHPRVNANGSAVRGYSVIMLMNAVSKVADPVECKEGEVAVDGKCEDLTVVCEDESLASMFKDLCNKTSTTCGNDEVYNEDTKKCEWNGYQGNDPYGDEDGDGVKNNADRCSNTKDGVKVNAEGCEEQTNKEGNLEVKISPKTPKGKKVPAGVVVEMASYEFQAGSNDVTIYSVELQRSIALADKDTVDSFALFKDGARISRSRNDNTEGLVTLSIPGGLTIKAGQKETLDLVVALGKAGVNNDTFTVSVNAVESTAKDINISAESESFEIGSQPGPKLDVTQGSSVANVKAGENQVAVSKFEIENNNTSKNAQDMKLYSITLKGAGTIRENEDMINYSLYINDTLFAKNVQASDRYVTFNNSDGFTVPDGKKLKMTVLADVEGGIDNTFKFEFENDLDIFAEGVKTPGYGVAVVAKGVNGGSAKVEAGTLVLNMDMTTSTKIRANKDDTVLARFELNQKAGKDLKIDRLVVNIKSSSLGNTKVAPVRAAKSSDVFENVQLLDSEGAKMELTPVACNALNVVLPAGTSSDCFATDKDEAHMIKDGKRTLTLIADVKKNSDLPTTFVGAKFEPQIMNIGYDDSNNQDTKQTTANGFLVREDLDDKLVSDIIPATLTFKVVEGSSSAVTLDAMPIGVSDGTNLYKVVGGTQDVVAMLFDLQASDISDIYLDDITVTVVDPSVAPALGNISKMVSEVKLYAGDLNAGTSGVKLLDAKSFNQANAQNELTFTRIDDELTRTEHKGMFKVEKTKKQRFTVTVSLIKDALNNGKQIKVSIPSDTVKLKSILEDDDSDRVAINSTVAKVSPRIIEILGNGGSLEAINDEANNSVKQKNVVLGGEKSEFVASFKLTAQDEDVNLKDLNINGINIPVGKTLSDYVSEVCLYNDSKELIHCQSVADGTNFAAFKDLDTKGKDATISVGSEVLYAKVKAHKIGKNQAGNLGAGMGLQLAVTKAEGAVTYKTLPNPAAISSKVTFDTVPVKLSTVVFEDEGKELSLAGTISSKIKFAADARTNTRKDNGAKLSLNMQKIKLTPDGNVTPNGITLTKDSNSKDNKIVLGTAVATFAENYTAPTLKYTVGGTIDAGDVYSITASGKVYSYTVVAGNTATTIADALEDAMVADGISMTNNSDADIVFNFADKTDVRTITNVKATNVDGGTDDQVLTENYVAAKLSYAVANQEETDRFVVSIDGKDYSYNMKNAETATNIADALEAKINVDYSANPVSSDANVEFTAVNVSDLGKLINTKGSVVDAAIKNADGSYTIDLSAFENDSVLDASDEVTYRIETSFGAISQYKTFKWKISDLQGGDIQYAPSDDLNASIKSLYLDTNYKESAKFIAK